MADKRERKRERRGKNYDKEVDESEANEANMCDDPTDQTTSISETSENGDILQAIQTLKNDLGMQMDSSMQKLRDDFAQRFNTVLETIQSVQGCIGQFSARLSETEERIGRAEDGVVSLDKTTTELKRIVEKLTAKVDDLENRDRRSNLRLVGLPEGAEGRDACSFLEKWIPETLGKERFTSPLVVERAHRVPGFRANSNAPPRALIMKFLNYRDKVQVMVAARAKGDILVGAERVRFFPDQSTELREKCRAFDGVKAKFKERGARYGILYPAVLLVTLDGRRHTFKTPSEAEKFLRSSTPTGVGS